MLVFRCKMIKVMHYLFLSRLFVNSYATGFCFFCICSYL